MKLYLISQNVNNGYDTYDSAVVAAKNEEEARKMHPGAGIKWCDGPDTWADPEDIQVEYIGTAKPGTKAGTVICASFNAG